MPLRPVTDVSPADWFVDSSADWWTKVCLGPPGFEAYVRVYFDMGGETTDVSVVSQVLDLLARHTATADNVFVGVWKGWGFWPQNHHPDATEASDFRLVNRDYQLLGGLLADAVDWQSLGLEGDWGGAVPHLIWPYDHEWFVAADVDPDWLGVGGSQQLIDELLADGRFDARPTAYDASDWETG
ncbi:MAG: hypothetical protein ABIR57_07050 [Aeromicrobium sp.]